ncbi:MAG: hypothetical protein A2958_01690 [Candidatus Levybacteria bacterium RIFCSPLOWO2_01_FULL_38_13]|nr:MAG: hypothetical protein A2629_01380 [Candidatus Levybacteria bacterium RIFCSPHIGHO2_01_FULL_41_15]OGH34656.1 MAG: hypothetical protein A2958_01690 [Candidatus Levybacteria bacterium RIFCSPLOWO2_01_FULL_38_13]
MKVADVMSTTLDWVATDTKIREVSRLIFGRGINGVPVCRGRKVIGFISEKDILSKFYPSMREYTEDPFREGNFEEMEEKVDQIFALTAEKIMSRNPTTVTPDTPLLKAQSLMFIHKVGRLPVVDKSGNLIGMITKGDIFRASVGDRLPLTDEEEYHDWQAKHYDIITDWKQRLQNEIPDLSALFRKHKVKDVIDIGFGTGEHDIALAKEGFNVLGIESSQLMAREAKKKADKLPQDVKKRLNFIFGDYSKILSQEEKKYRAAIFMGNAFLHLVPQYKKVLDAISNSLLSHGSVIVLQITNLERIFKVKNRVFDVTFGRSKHGVPSEHAFFRFYDPKDKNGYLTLNTAIFDHDERRWKFRTMNSAPIVNLNKNSVRNLLKKKGFGKISFYGGKFLGRLFREPFKPSESDWLNVIAVR